MVQRIRDFAEALRKDLGIVVKCEACAKCVTYRCVDFCGHPTAAQALLLGVSGLRAANNYPGRGGNVLVLTAGGIPGGTGSLLPLSAFPAPTRAWSTNFAISSARRAHVTVPNA